MIREYDKIKILVCKEGFPAGSVGVVVSLYNSGPACEVEVLDDNGYPADVVTYLLSEITPWE